MRTRREFVLVSLLGLAACGQAGQNSESAGMASRSSGDPNSLRADASRGSLDGGDPKASAAFSEVGLASWYGKAPRRRLTASGEKFDPSEMTGAHRTLAFNTVVRVTSLGQGAMVKVRINDRGPFVRGRVIDLSSRAAIALGIRGDGTAPVKLEVFAVDQA